MRRRERSVDLLLLFFLGLLDGWKTGRLARLVVGVLEQAPGLDVPDAYGLVARGGDDVVGGESDGVDCRAVAEEDLVGREGGVEAVDANRTVCGASKQLAFETFRRE